MTLKVSAGFARLIVAARDKFPEALETLKDWLQQTEQADYAIHMLGETGLAGKFPTDALQFLDLVVSRNTFWSKLSVEKCIRDIVAAKPDLADDPRVETFQHSDVMADHYRDNRLAAAVYSERQSSPTHPRRPLHL